MPGTIYSFYAILYLNVHVSQLSIILPGLLSCCLLHIFFSNYVPGSVFLSSPHSQASKTSSSLTHIQLHPPPTRSTSSHFHPAFQKLIVLPTTFLCLGTERAVGLDVQELDVPMDPQQSILPESEGFSAWNMMDRKGMVVIGMSLSDARLSHVNSVTCGGTI